MAGIAEGIVAVSPFLSLKGTKTGFERIACRLQVNPVRPERIAAAKKKETTGLSRSVFHLLGYKNFV